MNKNAIKKFAISARTRLIATVSDKAGTLGITKEGISEPSSKGNGFEVYKTSAGTEVMLQGSQMEQRRRLVAQVNARGFDVVMEEVAYTWFNRICAIRFMEVNDYLPSRIRVLSSLKEGKNEPDLLTEAPNVELDLTEKDREWIINAKTENRLDELFSMLFIKQCNKLSEILPELFEATQDYTEMLLNLSYTNKDDVIRMLVDGVDEKDFNVTTPDENGKPTGQVEIIGWLYQYYNTELKDDTFAQLKKNVKISKERIPAATQLFTPDWIVRYMVENSVGRIWIEHLRAINPETDEKATAESFGWKYYLPEAEQEPEVNTKLAEIRKSYTEIKPEDILCIDPCMGSGHIIVAMFDVLMDIYKSVGYGERDAAFEIVEHNLHGLDIDKRAYQLAYFAVMMKGRQYNRRFFRGKEEGQRPQPKVYAFVESNDVNRAQLKYFGAGLNELEKNNAITQMNGLLDTFKDAREYGSILNVDKYDWELLRSFCAETNDEGQMTFEAVGLDQTKETLQHVINVGEIMSRQYHAVVTNPPYMGNGGMNDVIGEYAKTFYPNSKTDMFAVFIEKCGCFAKEYGYYAMITQPSFLNLLSFEKLRKEIITKNTIISLLDMGRGIFGIDFGSTAFVIRNCAVSKYRGGYNRLYKRLFQFIDLNDIERLYLYSKGHEDSRYNFESYDTEKGVSEDEIGDIGNRLFYYSNQNLFLELPNVPFAYYVHNSLVQAFKESPSLASIAEIKHGMSTGNNDVMLRAWMEVNINDICFGATSHDSFYNSKAKYVPYNKGGDYRKWYGNQWYVLGYDKKFDELMDTFSGHRHDNKAFYFLEGFTWSTVSAGDISLRYTPNGYVFDSKGSMGFTQSDTQLYYVMAFINSIVCTECLRILSPTIDYNAGSLRKLPYIERDSEYIVNLVKENISLAREDWNSQETSWEFKKHPLVRIGTNKVKTAYEEWEKECAKRIMNLKGNEEKINEHFIKLFDMDELDVSVPEEKLLPTCRKADMKSDIVSLISYAVGCMFGRYASDYDGIVYAGGKWDESIYKTYAPDIDNIIPITDEEYFTDDIVGLFCDWVKREFGMECFEENLDFIAHAIGGKGNTSREVLRNYFINDFYKDHCTNYSITGSGKRPIYWLFDSGKQNGFKALIYIHRYEENTVGRVRTDYLHKTQKAIEQAMQSAQYTLDNSKSGTEKSKATKLLTKYTKQLAEIQLYDEAIAHIANKRIALDLDDGVKVNYEKFQGVEVSREGMKTVKIDLLAKI